MSEIKVTQDLSNASFDEIPSALKNVKDADNNTTVTTLAAGQNVIFGTTDGLVGGTDGNNASHFKLPTPKAAGERINMYPINAAVIAQPVGIIPNDPTTERITFQVSCGVIVATDTDTRISTTLPEPSDAKTNPLTHVLGAGTLINTTMTAAIGHARLNNAVKIAASKLKLGDKIECVSLSKTHWHVHIDCAAASGNVDADVASITTHEDGYVD